MYCLGSNPQSQTPESSRLTSRPASCYACRENRVATVREKYLENDFFLGQGKVREFCGWPGKFRKDLESQGKVRDL